MNNRLRTQCRALKKRTHGNEIYFIYKGKIIGTLYRMRGQKLTCDKENITPIIPTEPKLTLNVQSRFLI